MKDGNSLIIKKGSGQNACEVAVYTDLLMQFEVEMPTIYSSYKDESVGILIMKDMKGKTLEHNPQCTDFIEAAKTLSRIRNKARLGLKKEKLPHEKYCKYYVLKDTIIEDLIYISQQSYYIKTGQDALLERAIELLPKHVDRLYDDYPITLTHNDYHPKNLIRNNERIAVIDWAEAYLSPHLGDLYCLISAAKEYNVNPSELMHAYCEEIARDLSADIEWQVNIGGICWTIHAIRQLLDYGIQAIPIARDWIPDMIADICELMDDL